MKDEKKYIVHWVHKITGFSGHGEPVSKQEALDSVKYETSSEILYSIVEQTPSNETVANLTVRIYANDLLVAESENKALWGYALAKIVSDDHTKGLEDKG